MSCARFVFGVNFHCFVRLTSVQVASYHASRTRFVIIAACFLAVPPLVCSFCSWRSRSQPYSQQFAFGPYSQHARLRGLRSRRVPPASSPCLRGLHYWRVLPRRAYQHGLRLSKTTTCVRRNAQIRSKISKVGTCVRQNSRFWSKISKIATCVRVWRGASGILGDGQEPRLRLL